MSTKEFLWDLSLNVNLFFQVFLAFKPDEFRQNSMCERLVYMVVFWMLRRGTMEVKDSYPRVSSESDK